MKAKNIFTKVIEDVVIIDDRISALQKHKNKLNFRFITGEEKSKKITCNFCHHCLKKEYHDKNYYKCEFIGDSEGSGTDIRIHKNTCDYFKRREYGY